MIYTANRNYQCKSYCQQNADQDMSRYLSFNPSSTLRWNDISSVIMMHVCVFRNTQKQPTESIFIVGIYLILAMITLHWRVNTELKLGIGYFPFSQESLISWNSLSKCQDAAKFPPSIINVRKTQLTVRPNCNISQADHQHGKVYVKMQRNCCWCIFTLHSFLFKGPVTQLPHKPHGGLFLFINAWFSWLISFQLFLT